MPAIPKWARLRLVLPASIVIVREGSSLLVVDLELIVNLYPLSMTAYAPFSDDTLSLSPIWITGLVASLLFCAIVFVANRIAVSISVMRLMVDVLFVYVG